MTHDSSHFASFYQKLLTGGCGGGEVRSNIAEDVFCPRNATGKGEILIFSLQQNQ